VEHPGKKPYQTSPYAGMIRIRLYGYHLSPLQQGTPVFQGKDRSRRVNRGESRVKNFDF